jgi:hypothetical protein
MDTDAVLLANGGVRIKRTIARFRPTIYVENDRRLLRSDARKVKGMRPVIGPDDWPLAD